MVLALLLMTGLLAQTKEKPREITVTGCLQRSYFRVTTVDTSGKWVDKFKLRGNKDRLKALAKEHKLVPFREPEIDVKSFRHVSSACK